MTYQTAMQAIQAASNQTKQTGIIHLATKTTTGLYYVRNTNQPL